MGDVQKTGIAYTALNQGASYPIKYIDPVVLIDMKDKGVLSKMNTESRQTGYQEQKREFYRLEYPFQLRPFLVYQDRQLQIIDISEYGVNFHVEDPGEFTRGQQITGDIVFHDQQKYSCRGKVIRLASNNVVLNLNVPVPLHKIRSEHIFLIKRLAHKHD